LVKCHRSSGRATSCHILSSFRCKPPTGLESAVQQAHKLDVKIKMYQ
jgi:hypothetical protein